MRVEHFAAIGLILCIQWFLLGTGGMSTTAVVAYPFALLALLLPVPAYAWAFRNANLGVKSSRPGVRITIVGLVALGLSLVGFILGLVFFAGRVRVK
jgi:hypothetical protein